jgi:hypothetical protein
MGTTLWHHCKQLRKSEYGLYTGIECDNVTVGILYLILGRMSLLLAVYSEVFGKRLMM